MKHLLITTIAAVVLVGCGESQQSTHQADSQPAKPVTEVTAQPSPPPPLPPEVSLLESAKKGYTDAVKQHIAAGSFLNDRDKDGNTPIHQAAKEGHIEIVRLLIGAGVKINLNDRDKDGNTPIHQAAKRGDVEIVRLLVETGANVNIKNEHGAAPLNLTSSIKVAELLISKGADVNVKNRDYYAINPTILHRAVAFGDIEFVKLLLDSGADVNAKVNEGKTPLDNTAYLESKLIYNILREHGAKYSINYAAQHGDMEGVKEFLATGGDLNIVYIVGQTYMSPLHVAALYGQKKIVEFLVDKGADVNSPEASDYETPLDMAVKNDRSEVIDFLRSKGAKRRKDLPWPR